MKNFIKLIAVVILTICGISCSNDDNTEKPIVVDKQLVLSVDRSDIEVGDTVSFSVYSGKEKIEGFEIHINDQVIKGDVYTFNEIGIFAVIASKDGFKNSESVSINVSESNAKKTMTLDANMKDVVIGEEVMFTVKEGDQDLSGYTIQMEGGTKLDGNIWKTSEAGTFKFKATKEGYYDSNVLVINVNPDNSALILSLTTDSSEIFEDTPFLLSVSDGRGIAVGALLHINGVETDLKSNSKGVFEISQKQGVYNFTAVFEGKVSNALQIEVKSKDAPDTGDFGELEYNGEVYKINKSDITLWGEDYLENGSGDVVALWQIETITENTNALIIFNTPAYFDNTGEFIYELPKTANITPSFIAISANGYTGDITDQNITVIFNANLNDNGKFKGEYTATTTFNDKPFKVSFKGEMSFINESEN